MSEAATPAERERNLGLQPILTLLAAHGLKAHVHDAATTENLTHKMVARAGKGRWLTPNTQHKVWRALNRASGKSYRLDELFNYGSPPPPPAPSRADDHSPR